MAKYVVKAEFKNTQDMFAAVSAIRRTFGLGLREAVTMRDMAMGLNQAPLLKLPECEALEVGICLESAGATVDFEKAFF